MMSTQASDRSKNIFQPSCIVVIVQRGTMSFYDGEHEGNTITQLDHEPDNAGIQLKGAMSMMGSHPQGREWLSWHTSG